MHTILLVEDEQVTAMEIQAMLQELGYDIVDAVSRSDQVYPSVEEHEPDLIIMDIRLQGDEDGIDVVRNIQEARNIPVVYLTAHSDQETLDRARDTQPCGYLIKPVTQDDLKSTIETAVPG